MENSANGNYPEPDGKVINTTGPSLPDRDSTNPTLFRLAHDFAGVYGLQNMRVGSMNQPAKHSVSELFAKFTQDVAAEYEKREIEMIKMLQKANEAIGLLTLHSPHGWRTHFDYDWTKGLEMGKEFKNEYAAFENGIKKATPKT